MDLAGIEPATSSMPWKRAPSCATGPLRKKRLEPNDLPGKAGARSQLRHRPTIESRKAVARRVGIEGSTEFIFAHIAGIVNARDFSVCFHRHLLP